MTNTLKVSVWRGKAVGGFSSYEVPRQTSQTVLDVVTHIQRALEPSLSYRFACRVGMCGSCAMTVNGIARWTCRTHVAKVGWSALYGPPGMGKELFERWVATLRAAAKHPQWIAATEKAGSIPRVLSPAETEKFAAEQYTVYERLGRQLQIELK